MMRRCCRGPALWPARSLPEVPEPVVGLVPARRFLARDEAEAAHLLGQATGAAERQGSVVRRPNHGGSGGSRQRERLARLVGQSPRDRQRGSRGR